MRSVGRLFNGFAENIAELRAITCAQVNILFKCILCLLLFKFILFRYCVLLKIRENKTKLHSVGFEILTEWLRRVERSVRPPVV
jgi:hypothetical protein